MSGRVAEDVREIAESGNMESQIERCVGVIPNSDTLQNPGIGDVEATATVRILEFPNTRSVVYFRYNCFQGLIKLTILICLIIRKFGTDIHDEITIDFWSGGNCQNSFFPHSRMAENVVSRVRFW